MSAQAKTSDPRRKGRLVRLLDLVERFGNRLPDPVTIFFLLAVLALLASWAASAAGVSVVHPVSGETIRAVNLLSPAGIREVLTRMVTNFTGFAPLGTVLVAMIGIGLAERSGLFSALLRGVVLAMPRRLITPTIILAGILSNVAADAGFVILPPLAAMIYASLGRHPIAGIAAAFAGVGGGFSANLVIGTIDPLLAGISQEAARLVDADYEVYATASYYFMFVSTFMLTAVGTFISVRIVEPRLGTWNAPDAESSFDEVTPRERLGLWLAGLSVVLFIAVTMWFVLPENAILRDPETGDLKPLFSSLVALLMIVFILPGLVYGIVVGEIRNDRDASRMMSDTMAGMGSYVVMAFFAGQFIAYFNWSRLGIIIAISGAELLQQAKFTGAPLMVTFVIFAAMINLVMASSSAKWTMMAPIFVPMMMLLGYSPEATQGLYRVGDSVTNTITPLNYYFPVVIAVAQQYLPDTGLGTLIAAMLPYAVAFFIAWTIMVVLWITFGLPMGPGAPLHYLTEPRP